MNPNTPPLYSTGGRNPTATLSSTGGGGGSYLNPNSAYAIRREKSDGGGNKANRPISADMNRLASVAELAQLDRSGGSNSGGGPPKSWKPGHRRSSSYGSSSDTDKMYGPYHGGGGGAVSNNSGVGMGGMGGIGVGGGGLGHYIPGPSIYTSYAHPHQHQNPYTHLPLFPQYPGDGGGGGSGAQVYQQRQQQQQEENLRRSFSDIFLRDDESGQPPPPQPPLQHHHLPPSPYGMPTNYYSANDQLLDRAIDMLDPDLRPIPPQPNCPQSMQIYEEARMLAGEFISMRNQHADLQRYKAELEARLAEAEREEEEERRGSRPRQQPTQEEVEKFVRLQQEKEALLQFQDKLSTQLQLIKKAQNKQLGGPLPVASPSPSPSTSATPLTPSRPAPPPPPQAAAAPLTRSSSPGTRTLDQDGWVIVQSSQQQQQQQVVPRGKK